MKKLITFVSITLLLSSCIVVTPDYRRPMDGPYHRFGINGIRIPNQRYWRALPPSRAIELRRFYGNYRPRDFRFPPKNKQIAPNRSNQMTPSRPNSPSSPRQQVRPNVVKPNRK